MTWLRRLFDSSTTAWVAIEYARCTGHTNACINVIHRMLYGPAVVSEQRRRELIHSMVDFGIRDALAAVAAAQDEPHFITDVRSAVGGFGRS